MLDTLPSLLTRVYEAVDVVAVLVFVPVNVCPERLMVREPVDPVCLKRKLNPWLDDPDGFDSMNFWLDTPSWVPPTAPSQIFQRRP
jgi:hypothetical protein